MFSDKRVIAVIPAYNEGRTIRSVVEGLRSHTLETIVIDDCSSDDTSEQARLAGAFVIRNPSNKGYDDSINIGFAEAFRLGADIILTFDADAEHDPADVPRIIEPLREGRADVVAGQRPRATHFAERIFAGYTRLFYGIGDPLCGLKAYDRRVYAAIGFFDKSHLIGTELMLASVRKGFRLALVPIALHRRVDDNSRFYSRRFHANWKILKALWRVIRSRLSTPI